MKLKLFFTVSLTTLVILCSCRANALELVVSPEAIRQGGCVSFKIISTEGISKVRAQFLGSNFEFYRVDEGFRGIAGVPVDLKPGEYPLSIILSKDGAVTHEKNIFIKVNKTRFPLISFWLKPGKKKLLVKDLIAKEWARIEKSLLTEGEGQLWQGRFSLPVKGSVSMVFGAIERVNGKKTGQHRGEDIAVPSGTRVRAANGGKVVFAEKLKAFGGTMVVDHGQGIHALYFHLSKLISKVGEKVAKGDIIALSGNEGISSGAHLHWGMSVHNLRVDPLQWTKVEM